MWKLKKKPFIIALAQAISLDGSNHQAIFDWTYSIISLIGRLILFKQGV